MMDESKLHEIRVLQRRLDDLRRLQNGWGRQYDKAHDGSIDKQVALDNLKVLTDRALDVEKQIGVLVDTLDD